jgi:hypothetical protein
MKTRDEIEAMPDGMLKLTSRLLWGRQQQEWRDLLVRALMGDERTGRHRVTMQHRTSPEGVPGFEIVFWANPRADAFFYCLADPTGLPILTPEIAEALRTTLGEKGGETKCSQ